MARITDGELTLADLAAFLGWTVKTARVMQHRANQRRAQGQSRPGDLPPPDRRYGRTPVWSLATITEWQARRPGQGSGGGPKPRT